MEYLKKITIHALLLLAFFTSTQNVAFAAKKELIIKPPLKHAGLSFEAPLKIDYPEKLKLKPVSIEFIDRDTVGKNTPTPTPKTSPSPSPTPEPTITPTPTSAPTNQPTQSAQTGSNTSNGGLNADILFNMSNDYRAGRGLATFQKNERICSLAAERAPEIAAEISGGYMHAGFRSRNVQGAENIITMRTEQEAFSWWVNDPPHLAAIVGNYTYSCVACAGNACTQEFSN